MKNNLRRKHLDFHRRTLLKKLKSPLEGRSSSRERSASPEKKLSDQQLQLGNHYLIGKQKQILDIETYYEKPLPSAVAEVVSTFSPTAETKISQHRKYDRAYEQNDIILLFKIIDQCAVLTPTTSASPNSYSTC